MRPLEVELIFSGAVITSITVPTCTYLDGHHSLFCLLLGTGKLLIKKLSQRNAIRTNVWAKNFSLDYMPPCRDVFLLQAGDDYNNNRVGGCGIYILSRTEQLSDK